MSKIAGLGASEYELMYWFGWQSSSTPKEYIARTGGLARRYKDRIE